MRDGDDVIQRRAEIAARYAAENKRYEEGVQKLLRDYHRAIQNLNRERTAIEAKSVAGNPRDTRGS